MNPLNISRRDFLKLIAATSVSAYFSPQLNIAAKKDQPNVLILLFDALSARHMSVYDYPRETTPNMARFAEKATVYNKHYATSNFTSPATASILMGMYPWKHRAFNQAGKVLPELESQNIFGLFSGEFNRSAFAQTPFASVLAKQFQKDIDHLLPLNSFSIGSNRFLPDGFLNERGLDWHLFDDFVGILLPNMPGSLVGGYLNDIAANRNRDYQKHGFPEYPRGLPWIFGGNTAFTLEDVFAGVEAEILKSNEAGKSFLNYYHLYSPHEPYNPHIRFFDKFKDDYLPNPKPMHPLAKQFSEGDIAERRVKYDRYVANVDYEFGLLIDSLEKSGILNNTYVIVTADHGELFERGEYGHGTALLYEDVIRIPLLIHAPKQSSRQDVNINTSHADLLPTLLHLYNKEIPNNLDGEILPGFGGNIDSAREIYSMHSQRNSAFLPLTIASIALMQGQYKLIYTFGYENYSEIFELYNLTEDPEELNNLIDKDVVTAEKMKKQLLDALDEANKPFQR